jgi:hypothetical protein
LASSRFWQIRSRLRLWPFWGFCFLGGPAQDGIRPALGRRICLYVRTGEPVRSYRRTCTFVQANLYVRTGEPVRSYRPGPGHLYRRKTVRMPDVCGRNMCYTDHDDVGDLLLHSREIPFRSPVNRIGASQAESGEFVGSPASFSLARAEYP